jgi:glycerol uptake facilitator-like aquaporin
VGKLILFPKVGRVFYNWSTIVNVIVGTVITFFVFNFMVVAIFPDFYIEQHASSYEMFSPPSTYGLFRGVVVVYFAGTALLCFLCVGIAHSRAYSKLFQREVPP